jgi:hypothetical protein
VKRSAFLAARPLRQPRASRITHSDETTIMNNLASILARATIAPVVCVSLLAATARAQERPSGDASSATSSAAEPARHARSIDARAPLHVAHKIDHSRMMYDAPGDGSVWARGASYKASFDANGATYFPAFGRRAPRDFPHVLSPDGVSVGATAIELAHAASAARDGDRVALDRGAFVEEYELSPQSVEQRFVFSSLPNRGDLLVHIPVASELAPTATVDGIEFDGEFGRVTYGRATAIDAHGRRTEAATELENGSITIRVGASFLAEAALPLVIDPLVSTIFFPGVVGADDFSADVVGDPFTQGWLVVWEETFSASDTDVYCEFLSSTGSVLASGTIDFTTAAWASPRCAGLPLQAVALVVSGVTTGTAKTVMGRMVTFSAPSLPIGVQFTISGGEAGGKVNADVGGDPFEGSAPSYFCVVYQHNFPTVGSEIAVRRVAPDMTMNNVLFLPSTLTTPDIEPSISKSDDTREWLVAWERISSGIGNIYSAHIHWDGTLFDGPTQITSSLISTSRHACASSPISGTSRELIAYEFDQDNDIWLAAVNGASLLNWVDLSTLVNPNGTGPLHEIEPSIDCDGQHFVVTYSEPTINGPAPYTVFASQVYLSDTLVFVKEPHVLLHQFGLSERRSNVCAVHKFNQLGHRYFVAYDFEQNATDHDIAGALFDAAEGGQASSFCFGDGTQQVACPCGNNGSAGNGCGNSTNGLGANLTMSGTISTLDDTASMHVAGMPLNATCVFLQGTGGTNGVLFGDGLRCVAGTLLRLAVKHGVLGQANYPESGDQPISVRGNVPTGGGLRAYQVWYRDNSPTFCTSLTYNISSGELVYWAP